MAVNNDGEASSKHAEYQSHVLTTIFLLFAQHFWHNGMHAFALTCYKYDDLCCHAVLTQFIDKRDHAGIVFYYFIDAEKGDVFSLSEMALIIMEKWLRG